MSFFRPTKRTTSEYESHHDELKITKSYESRLSNRLNGRLDHQDLDNRSTVSTFKRFNRRIIISFAQKHAPAHVNLNLRKNVDDDQFYRLISRSLEKLTGFELESIKRVTFASKN